MNILGVILFAIILATILNCLHITTGDAPFWILLLCSTALFVIATTGESL